ncbi:hypothetical protein BpHYR1_051184 [Brachionus plicatilis]|uniref:Uncharacterized protein n=1 Tax=Brachionus plicatilis TaxID=10195 RepID=A0A3M7QQK0_BRAPC|nr:hypothetical protein BpHYR1_051184 [Brachionus plicatilis]
MKTKWFNFVAILLLPTTKNNIKKTKNNVFLLSFCWHCDFWKIQKKNEETLTLTSFGLKSPKLFLHSIYHMNPALAKILKNVNFIILIIN